MCSGSAGADEGGTRHGRSLVYEILGDKGHKSICVAMADELEALASAAQLEFAPQFEPVELRN